MSDSVYLEGVHVLHVLCKAVKIFLQYSIQKAAVMLRISHTWNSWIIHRLRNVVRHIFKNFYIDDDDDHYRHVLKSFLKAIGKG